MFHCMVDCPHCQQHVKTTLKPVSDHKSHWYRPAAVACCTVCGAELDQVPGHLSLLSKALISLVIIVALYIGIIYFIEWAGVLPLYAPTYSMWIEIALLAVALVWWLRRKIRSRH